jgi:hypothetical protein
MVAFDSELPPLLARECWVPSSRQDHNGPSSGMKSGKSLDATHHSASVLHTAEIAAIWDEVPVFR